MPRTEPPQYVVLQLLVALQDRGSIGTAADAVGMTQPNASRALRRYERRCGVPLLVRSPKGTRLTPEGDLVVAWARDVISSTERLVAGTDALSGTLRGRLRVAASQTVAEYLVPGWLADYRQSPGAVEVELTVANSVQVSAAVLDGSADLGFIESATLTKGLRARQVGTDRLVVVVTPAHPWARLRNPLPAAELAATPLVVREPGSGTRDALEQVCHGAGLTVVEPAQSLASNAAVRVAAMAGVAPAALSEHAVREAVDTGRLVRVEVDGLDLARALRAVWRGGAAPLPAARELVRCAAGAR